MGKSVSLGRRKFMMRKGAEESFLLIFNCFPHWFTNHGLWKVRVPLRKKVYDAKGIRTILSPDFQAVFYAGRLITDLGKSVSLSGRKFTIRKGYGKSFLLIFNLFLRWFTNHGLWKVRVPWQKKVFVLSPSRRNNSFSPLLHQTYKSLNPSHDKTEQAIQYRRHRINCGQPSK